MESLFHFENHNLYVHLAPHEKNAADGVISLWRTAEAFRPRLLESAKEQGELSRSHYRAFAHDRAAGYSKRDHSGQLRAPRA